MPNFPSEDVCERVCGAYQTGDSLRKLAKSFKIHRNTIQQILNIHQDTGSFGKSRRQGAGGPRRILNDLPSLVCNTNELLT